MPQPLPEAFPQPKDLLAVQPEELAGVLIAVLPGLMQQAGSFSARSSKSSTR